MRLLFVHSDHLEFEATAEAGEGVAETEGVPTEGRMEDCVTAFVSVERPDGADPDAVAENAADELRDVAGRLDTREVVLYPCAHLSDDPADPDAARVVVRTLEAALDADFEVLRAPVGWHTAFEVSCKGHPLSELSRHVTPERGEADGDDADRSPSEWRLAFPEGETVTLPDSDPFGALDDRQTDRVSDDVRALLGHEVEGGTDGADGEPPHVELLRELELVGRDELGDAGGLRWYPRGKLIRDSLTEYATDLAVEYGVMPVETPVAYDLGVRAVREHADSFGERRSGFGAGDRRATRLFDACVGHFSVMRDADVAESDLPLRLHETSTSVRRGHRGEVTGLQRQSAFATPVTHTATRDLERAKAELAAQAELSLRAGEDLGLNYEPTIRVTEAFYDGNEAWVESLVEDLGRPALLELLPERRHNWSVGVDFATVDRLGRPVETAAVRLDVESAERFDITYDAGGESRHPPVLHSSLPGGNERVLAALLEAAAGRETPRLPTWLSPTQVRFVPVGDDHVDHCVALADDLESSGIRADVDERDETVGERIATAETDWVPYYAVIGDREVDGDGDGVPLKVTVRAAEEERELTVEELEAAVLADVGDLPRRKRYLPKRVSRRPGFTGR